MFIVVPDGRDAKSHPQLPWTADAAMHETDTKDFNVIANAPGAYSRLGPAVMRDAAGRESVTNDV